MTKRDDIPIRLEQASDYRTVEELTREAFWNVHVPGCDEHSLVHKLRDHADFIPELDFVALVEGKLVGNIMYSKAKVVAADGREWPLLSFGPISVLPAYQRRGVGAALIEHSGKKALALGHEAVLIYGNPEYYRRFGFHPAEAFSITTSEGNFHPALQALELKKGALDGVRGRFHESPVYHLDKNESAAFDAGFPPKEKFVTESQRAFARLAGLPEPK